MENDPKWELVYYYFTKWRNDGTIDLLIEVIRKKVRKKYKKDETRSARITYSQPVKTTRKGGDNRGFDGGKKVKGRKRHTVVDALGLLVVMVYAANRHDSKAAFEVLTKLKGQFFRLVKVFDAGGYRGELIDYVKNNLKFLLEVVLRADKDKKFKMLPKRWIVERTFSWFESYRRLSKDFEYHTKTREAIIPLAMLNLMLNRLEK